MLGAISTRGDPHVEAGSEPSSSPHRVAPSRCGITTVMLADDPRLYRKGRQNRLPLSRYASPRPVCDFSSRREWEAARAAIAGGGLPLAVFLQRLAGSRGTIEGIARPAGYALVPVADSHPPHRGSASTSILRPEGYQTYCRTMG